MTPQDLRLNYLSQYLDAVGCWYLSNIIKSISLDGLSSTRDAVGSNTLEVSTVSLENSRQSPVNLSSLNSPIRNWNRKETK
jgi:hypothetical protein